MKRIIIVDDSIFLIQQLKAFFETVMGHEVIAVAGDGAQAVALYHEHNPDLITLDITMPNKNGIEALAEILTVYPSARVLMISAVLGPGMTRCLKMVAKGYMEKPMLFNDEQFQINFKETLSEVFDG